MGHVRECLGRSVSFSQPADAKTAPSIKKVEGAIATVEKPTGSNCKGSNNSKGSTDGNHTGEGERGGIGSPSSAKASQRMTESTVITRMLATPLSKWIAAQPDASGLFEGLPQYPSPKGLEHLATAFKVAAGELRSIQGCGMLVYKEFRPLIQVWDIARSCDYLLFDLILIRYVAVAGSDMYLSYRKGMTQNSSNI